MAVHGASSRFRNALTFCFAGPKLHFDDFLEIQDFSEMWPLLGAHVLENARGSSLARISLLCGGALLQFRNGAKHSCLLLVCMLTEGSIQGACRTYVFFECLSEFLIHQLASAGQSGDLIC